MYKLFNYRNKEEETYINTEEVMMIEYKNSEDSPNCFHISDWLDEKIDKEEFCLFSVNVHFKNGKTMNFKLTKKELLSLLLELDCSDERK